MVSLYPFVVTSSDKTLVLVMLHPPSRHSKTAGECANARGGTLSQNGYGDHWYIPPVCLVVNLESRLSYRIAILF